MPKVERESPCVTWDVTLNKGDNDELPTPSAVAHHLNEVADKWCFQKEIGKEGRLHYQIRIKFRPDEKKREMQAIRALIFGPLKGGHVTRTSKECVNDMSYVKKVETRVEGPWTSNDKVIKDPGWIATELRPWQQRIVDIINTKPDDRTIHLIVDTEGCIGKSTLVRYLCHHNLADVISDLITGPKDISRHVAGSRAYVGITVKNAYVLDIPKDNRNTREIWHCLESVKNGMARDDRYTHRKIDPFPHPHIFVFTNTRPPPEVYTKKRIVEINPE